MPLGVSRMFEGGIGCDGVIFGRAPTCGLFWVGLVGFGRDVVYFAGICSTSSILYCVPSIVTESWVSLTVTFNFLAVRAAFLSLPLLILTSLGS